MRWALRNARLMRKRFTTADLVGFLGLYDQAWEDQVVAKVMAAIRKRFEINLLQKNIIGKEEKGR